ncbi:class I SAM-dependent methyltransferase [Mesorhizobium sp. M0060]|uniref:class I SAM-dependent DNA methyltransferase n=1 Tax=Mesorhizobium sp. M0060 TaxID=2956866 RepID=UPI003338BA37
MASNQELFANGLAANQKVIEANYMAHREALWPAAWGPDGRGAGTLRLHRSCSVKPLRPIRSIQSLVDRFYNDSFLAAVYDAWHPRAARDDYDFYLPRIMAANSVLDVGCGTGTLLHEARKAGHPGRLCGIDPAPGVLDRARKHSDIEWVLGYLQSQDWVAQFDLIVMTGHAFQSMASDEEQRDFVVAVRRALVAGGRFAFELRNPLARAWECWTPENAVSVEGPGGSSVLITTELVSGFNGRTITFTHTFSGEHPSLPQVSQSTLRFLDADALRKLLEDAGLRIEQQFGDFDGRAPSPTSPEIITFAMH